MCLLNFNELSMSNNKYHLEQREDLLQKWDEYWEEFIKNNPKGGNHE